MSADSILGRRRFLLTLFGTGAALSAGRALRAQEASTQGQLPGSSGRLYDPRAVQERTPTVSADNDHAIMAVEKTLKCQCGCNLDIYTCRTTDFTCTTSPALHRDIVALRDQGKSAEDIRQAFVARYGEQALMAPVPEGFNLAGYLVPGSVMLAGVALLTAWLVRRQRQVARVAVPAGVPAAGATGGLPPSDATPEELDRLQRALREGRE